MKQLLFSAVLLLFSISVFAQATPVGELRVADATTAAFGVNVPIGTKIFNYGTGQYWVATAAIVSTKKLSDAISDGSVKLINPVQQSITTTASGTQAIVNLSKTTLTSGAEVAASDVLTFSSVGPITITSDAAKAITVTASEAQALGYTNAVDQGTITISGGNGSPDDVIIPGADGNFAGLMTKAQWQSLFGTVAPETGKLTVKSFEQSAPGATFDIVDTPKAGMSVLVSLNGQELPLTSGYTIAANIVTIVLPTLAYDKVVVTYMK